jgi:hypothetical protein
VHTKTDVTVHEVWNSRIQQNGFTVNEINTPDAYISGRKVSLDKLLYIMVQQELRQQKLCEILLLSIARKF